MGYDWASMFFAGIGAAVAIVTLLVVMFQTQLMGRQTQIIEKQDEILGRRAKLTVFVRVREPDPDNARVFEIRARNEGKKLARWYYYHLYVPITVRGLDMSYGGGDNPPLPGGETVERLDTNLMYRRFSEYVRKPLIPVEGRSAIIALMTVTRPQTPFKLGWQLASEDGRFPEDVTYGEIDIST